MIRFLRKSILNNWPLKLLALAISVGLWTVYAAQPVAEFSLDVPLAFANVPKNLTIANDLPASIHLLMQGHVALLRRLAPADLAFTVDLSDAVAGDRLVRLTPSMIAPPYGTNVLRISPAALHISLVANAPVPVAARP